jgi:hypothetical protein
MEQNTCQLPKKLQSAPLEITTVITVIFGLVHI